MAKEFSLEEALGTGTKATTEFSLDEALGKPPQDSGFLRQVADVPLSIGRGAATGVRMIADAFGAGSGASEAIKGVEGYLSSLMSAQAKNDEREIARIMKDAEDKGVLDQVKAGFKAFSVAPVDLLSQGLGTAAPAILGVLGGKVLGAGALGMSAISTGVGAGMGAGSAKGGIYEEVKAALKESGVDEAKAEQAAIQAQEYGGKNLDQILLSAGLGGVAGRFGVESAAKRILTRAAAKETGKGAAREVAEGAARTAVTESVPELLQGSQEQVAKNIALQREGFDVPTMRGVAGSGTLEALAGAGLGAVTGGTEAGLRRQARGEADRILAEEEKTRAEAPAVAQEPQPSPTQAIEDQAAELERQQQRQQAAMDRARAGGIGGGSGVNQTMLEQARIRKEQQERAAAAEEKAANAERQKALRAERARIGSTQYSGDPMMNEVLRSRAIADFDAANAPKVETPKAPEYQPTKTIEQTTPIEQPKDFNVLRGVDSRGSDFMSAVSERRAKEEAAAAVKTKEAEAQKTQEAAKVDTSRADVDQRVAQVENFLMSPVKKTQQETADYMAGVVPEMQKDFLALLDEDMSQPLTPEQTEALKTQIRQRLNPEFAPEETVQRTPFKKFLASKGMNKKDVQDIFGANAYRANQQLPGAIRADAPRLDMLAEAAVEAGFLQEEDTEALVQMIKDEFSGDEQVAVDMAEDRAAAEYEAQRENELASRAGAIGLNTKGMKPEQIAARLDRIERKREEKRKQYNRNVDGFADLPTEEQDRIIDMMIDQFGEPQVFDVERAEIEGRVREEEELLQTQTEKQLRDKQAEIDRLAKENERLSKEAERKAKADEEAGDFVLTGSKRDADKAAARGQMELGQTKAPPTDSTAFRRWFGDSKVVDENGEPLVVYHGTTANFSVFNEGAPRNVGFTKDAKGFYFSADADVASGYATYPMLTRDKTGGNVMPVYLSIKSPMRLESGSAEHTIITPAKLADYEAQGYDGIIVGDFEEIVAFRPEQIKSATGNMGTYDPETADIRYKRATGKVGIGKQAVQDTVDTVKARWANAPEVVVAENMDDPAIPEAVRAHNKEAIAKGAKGSPKGFFYKGKAYILADSMTSSNDVMETLFHESLGHYGLRGTFGPEMGKVLADVVKNRRADVEAKAKQYGLDPKSDKDMLEAAEEVLAVMAQTKPGLSFVKRAISVIRNFLRDLGLPFKMSNEDIIQKYILPARAFVESGKGRPTGGKPAAAREAGAGSQIYKDAEAIAAMDEDVRDNMEVGEVPGGSEAYNLYEAKKLLKKPSDKLKRVTDSNSFSLWQDWDYIANVDGEYFGVSKEEDPDATDDEDAFVFSYARLDDPRNVKTTYTTDVGDLMSNIRADSMGGKPAAMREPAKAPPTDSSAFKKWFGDSKVVDENGEPMVVYHGTFVRPMGDGTDMGDITAFDRMFTTRFRRPSIDTVGSWFSTNPGEGGAEMYSGKDQGAAIYPVYLSIKNPQITTFQLMTSRARKLHNGKDDGRPIGAEEVEAYRAWLKSMGKDGIKIEASGNEGSTEFDNQVAWIALEPTQIKSATGNIGTYDPENADIRYQRESEPEAGQLKPSRQNIFGEPVLGTWSITVDPKMELQDGLIYKLLDKNIDVKRIVEAVKSTGKQIASQWNPYLQEELYHGRTANASQEFQDKEWLPLLQDMDKKGVTIGELEKYLHNRHAEDYNKLVAKRNPNRPEMQDGGSGVTTEFARKYLAGLDADTKAKYDELAARVDGITKGTRKLLLDTGYENQEKIRAWEKAFPNYVPLMREEGDFDYNFGSFGTGRGFDVRRDFSRSAMGSKRNVVDIIGNVIAARNNAIALTEKNRVAQAVYGLALEAPNPDFWMAINPEAEKIPEDAIDELRAMGLDEEAAEYLMKEPKQRVLDPKRDQIVSRINTKLRENDFVLATRINGEKRYVFFNPKDPRSKRAATALKNLDAQDLGTALGMIAKVTRWMASVNTQYNPIFGPYNFLRDIQSAALQLSTTELAGQQKEIAANVVPSLRAIYSSLRKRRKGDAATGEMADLWKEFQKEGGQTGFKDNFSRTQDRTEALLNEMEKITEGKVKANARAVFDWLSDYNDSLENAVRLSAYKVAKKKFSDEGFSDSEAKQKAASLAKNLTVNFNRKGDVATQMGALYAFFNASMQGTARMIETLKGPTGKKIMAGGLLLGSMQAALLAAAGFDDEEPPEFIRSKNIVIPTGDGDYIAFPMPLGFHVIPGFSRILTEWTLSGFEDTARRVTDLTGLFLDAFNPVGNAGWSVQTIAPTFADPFVALGENKDWTGKPISKEDIFSLKPTPGYTRAREGANWLSTKLAEFLNFSSGGDADRKGVVSPTPEQIEYLVGQAFGGVGREAIKLTTTIQKTVTGEDLPPYKIPLYGRFVGETKSSAAESNKFYKNMMKLNELQSVVDGRRDRKEPIGDFMRENPEARLLPMANKTYKDVQALRKRRAALVERDAPKESVQAVEKMITRKMQVLNDRVRALKESN